MFSSWTPKKTLKVIDNTIKARANSIPIPNTLALANSQTAFIGRNFDLLKKNLESRNFQIHPKLRCDISPKRIYVSADN